MRNYFRFLKLEKWKIILSVILVAVIFIIWMSVIPKIGGVCSNCNGRCSSIIFKDTYCVNNDGANLVLLANLILGIASIIILYTVLSLIVYLGKGEWKNDK